AGPQIRWDVVPGLPIVSTSYWQRGELVQRLASEVEPPLLRSCESPPALSLSAQLLRPAPLPPSPLLPRQEQSFALPAADHNRSKALRFPQQSTSLRRGRGQRPQPPPLHLFVGLRTPVQPSQVVHAIRDNEPHGPKQSQQFPEKHKREY